METFDLCHERSNVSMATTLPCNDQQALEFSSTHAIGVWRVDRLFLLGQGQLVTVALCFSFHSVCMHVALHGLHVATTLMVHGCYRRVTANIYYSILAYMQCHVY